LHYDLKQELTDKFDTLHQTLHATIDTSVKNHLALLKLSNVLSHSLHLQKTGIHQHESKNFSVSKLQKELKEISLHGDTGNFLGCNSMSFHESMSTKSSLSRLP
jgi:hypothetical protein